MIDIHAHYVSPSLLKAAEREESLVVYDPGKGVFSFPSGATRPIPPALLDLDARAKWIRERSIDIQVVSPWMDIAGDDLPDPEATAWCRLYNDTMAQDVSGSPMFEALGALPMSSGEAAAEELRRVVLQHRFLGGAIPTQIRGGVDLDTADLDPLFSTAQELGVPLLIHPYRVMARNRMDRDFLFNICGNPFETTLAAMRLFFWGVFDKWPSLKLVLAHTGGALSLLAGRAWHATMPLGSTIQWRALQICWTPSITTRCSMTQMHLATPSASSVRAE